MTRCTFLKRSWPQEGYGSSFEWLEGDMEFNSLLASGLGGIVLAFHAKAWG